MADLSPEEKEALAARCWHSRVEFARIFLPDWFPRKMPWVHRGIIALLTRDANFLLDFGTESWRDETCEWTPADLAKILSNFVTADSPGDESTSWSPIFRVEECEDGTLTIEIDARENVAVIMPRGFSKTTVINLVNLTNVLYKTYDFFSYTSEAGAHAERQLGTIGAQLRNNDLIRSVFGELVPGRQHPNKWTEQYIEPLNGVMVAAVGSGGQVRGFSKDARRPDVIVADDLETDESVASDSQRAKDSRWFFSTLSPAIRKGGRLFAIGTLLHSDAILNKLERSPEWTWVRFGNRDREGEPLWAYQMDNEAIEKKKVAMEAVGELAGYYLEYESKVITDTTRMFPVGKLVRIAKPISSFIGMALAQDPAISQESTADFCCFAVVGIEAGGVKHVLDFHGEQGMDPAAQIDKFFELHFRWLCKIPPDYRRHGIEAVGFQRALVHLVRSEQFRRSHEFSPWLGRVPGNDAYFEVEPIKHSNMISKITRVQGVLKPIYHAGYLTFERPFAELDSQLAAWPAGKKDGPDVVAMAITLLDPFASLNLGLDSSSSMAADTAPPLRVVMGGKSFARAP